MAIRARKFPALGGTAFAAVLLISPLLAQSVGPLLYQPELKSQLEKHADKRLCRV
jgi:hypothetical protein